MIDDNEIDERLVNSDVIDNIESNDITLRPWSEGNIIRFYIINDI